MKMPRGKQVSRVFPDMHVFLVDKVRGFSHKDNPVNGLLANGV
ncbi:uncharacterized protein METZ01_LOCUS317643 [marine metagenome]|uniref:Uncharacterized protein n=1 Tax=marine metagenome TaxID=408172 RepID=A0A382NUE8_9ZZZZ